MKMTIMDIRSAKAGVSLGFLLLGLALTPRGAEAVNYGWTDMDGQSSDSSKIAFHSSSQLELVNGDMVKGYANLAGGFAVEASGEVYFSHVVAPVGGTILLRSGASLVVAGDLRLASTAQLNMTGPVSIDGGGGALILQGNLALPGEAITLVNTDWVIDGQGHCVTFNASTIFALGGRTLTLKNMTIRGLSGSSQFTGVGTLALDNCKIDISAGNTFVYGNADLTIANDVVVRGGGRFQFSGLGTMSINLFSTLRVEPQTTFDYACMTRGSLVMAAPSSTLYLDNCTLKAQGPEGLELITGKVIADGEVTLDNGANTIKANGIQLGNGVTAVNMLFKPGARFNVLGQLWYNLP